MTEKKKSLMYEVNGKRTPTWNPFCGCDFNCVYCYGPEVYKRFSKCEKCKKFTPHFHKERLKQKFKPGETWFVCSMGDISFASFEQFNKILETTNYYLDTTFYIQSKNPAYFNEYIEHYSSDIRSNIVLGTTLETNSASYSPFRPYFSNIISKAPYPELRLNAMVKLKYQKGITEFRKSVTIEPIMEFSLPVMVEWIKQIAPEFVYVGYTNPVGKAKKLRLPEPPLEKVKELCRELAKFTDVRLKTMRRAWNE